MSKQKIILASALLCFAPMANADNPADLVWISLPANAAGLDAGAPQYRLTVQKGDTNSSAPEDVRAILMEQAQLDTLSEKLHDHSGHGPGYILHSSLEDALAAQQVQRRPSYDMGAQEVVQRLMGQIDETRLIQVIQQLSGFETRLHTSPSGAQASVAIRDLWKSWAGNRTDVQVEQVAHVTTPQKSVVLTIAGSEKPDEVIVLGGHLDSTSGGPQAPGADDNASGIASLSEVIRVLLENNFQPKRTLKFIAYAAEEAGLRGSGEIAQSHRQKNIDVLGALQLDMTNYKGSTDDIYLYDDYTDAAQNDFLRRLIVAYQPGLRIGTSRCGYGCSDHASWNRYGYAASFPVEARFGQHNPYIHSTNDTLEMSGGGASHAAKFSRLALSYAIELGSGTSVVSSTAQQD